MAAPERHWHAWYTEGREYDSHETDWLTLPAVGVLAITVYFWIADTLYRENKLGGDWYWLENGEMHYLPSQAAVDGTWVPKPTVSCTSCVKRGDWAPEEWPAVLQRVRSFRGRHLHPD